MIDELVSYNREFVKNKGYEKYITNKYPDKKIAIVSCMDTRLTELLPASLGIKNGDVKIIKNAGAIISHPFGSVIRRDRKSTRLNSSHPNPSRMPSSA